MLLPCSEANSANYHGAFADDGWSGTTQLRPGLDRIYVFAPDRLAWRYVYQVMFVGKFHRAGVEVVFRNRAVAGSARDDLLLQVQG